MLLSARVCSSKSHKFRVLSWLAVVTHAADRSDYAALYRCHEIRTPSMYSRRVNTQYEVASATLVLSVLSIHFFCVMSMCAFVRPVITDDHRYVNTTVSMKCMLSLAGAESGAVWFENGQKVTGIWHPTHRFR